MSIFTRRVDNPNWLWPVSGMCLILGVMMSFAWVTPDNRKDRSAFLPAQQSERISAATADSDAFQQLTLEVQKLRQEKTKLENALASTNGQTEALNENLQETKVFAGLTDLQGPGVTVTLSDSVKPGSGSVMMEQDSIIHDIDVLRTVNELFNAGAEAVDVNGHRVTGRTNIRCVGSTILINDVKIASPVVVRAIGDPDTLFGAINMNGGVLAMIREADQGMVRVEKNAKLTIKAYAGPTNVRIATVPPAPESKATPETPRRMEPGNPVRLKDTP